MVPFGFRLLLAEIPRYVGKYQEALARLYTLLSVVKNVSDGLLIPSFAFIKPPNLEQAGF